MSFDGRWAITIATPIGKQEVVLDIEESGDTVTGTATQGAETVPFQDAATDGDRIRWSQRITKPMTMLLKFDLTRQGDSLSGTVKPGIMPSTAVTGTRLAD